MNKDTPPTQDLAEQIGQLLQDFREALQAVSDDEALYALQVRFLGKKGSLSQLRKGMGKLDPDARKAFGQLFNQAKDEIEKGLESHKLQLAEQSRQRELAKQVDLSAALQSRPPGTLHPITQTRRRLEKIFARLGFDVAEGPHIEHELYNFDKLNILAGHPARDMQDTFFVEPRSESKDADPLVLRTHTSPVQIRTMLQNKPPIRIVAPGTVFRRDDDATHSPMFHQIEGLYVDRGVTMVDLKETLYRFVTEFFGQELKLRFRPSYFPFVEPGAEFDIENPFVSSSDKGQSSWIEVGGAGMVHPAVFESVGIDPEVYSGWAFGFGIDRMAMLHHRVHDLRLFFENDQRFLEQFPC